MQQSYECDSSCYQKIMTSKVMVRFRVEVMIMGSRGNDSSFVKFNKKAALKGSGRELPGQLKKKGGPVSNPSEVESTGCAQPEENLCPTLLLLDEERFPLTIVSTRRTNGKSCYYERVARLDAPHSRLTCWCCRHHSSVGGSRLAANHDAAGASADAPGYWRHLHHQADKRNILNNVFIQM